MVSQNTCDLHWIRLARTFALHPLIFYKLLHYYGGAREALNHIPFLLHHKKIPHPVTLYSLEDAKKELELVHKAQGVLLALGDSHYPKILSAIPDPPPLLTVFGNLRLLHQPMLAILGSRTPSMRGRRFCEMLAKNLGDHGYGIVSGFSQGIEESAHKGAIKTGTIGVLVGGIENIPSLERKKFYAEVLEFQGTFLSEMPLGTVAKPRHFLKRTRLISGLARGIIVMEATPDSSAFITTQMALDQGRDVFAVPGSPYDAWKHGTNTLIKQGATLIDSPEDILETYRMTPSRTQEGTESFESLIKSSFMPENLSPRCANILNYLRFCPTPVDETSCQCQIKPPS